MKTFKHYLQEMQTYKDSSSWSKVLKTPVSDDTTYNFYERLSDIRNEALSELLADLPQRLNKVKISELKRVYDEFQSQGFLRNSKLLDNIIEKCLINIIKLQVNTELAGHEQTDPYKDYLEYVGEDEENILTLEEFGDKVYNYVENNISDYGMKWAIDIGLRLAEATSDNVKIVLLNHLFDIIHQRSDFAEFFVEGGSSALSQLSGIDHGIEEDE